MLTIKHQIFISIQLSCFLIVFLANISCILVCTSLISTYKICTTNFFCQPLSDHRVCHFSSIFSKSSIWKFLKMLNNLTKYGNIVYLRIIHFYYVARNIVIIQELTLLMAYSCHFLMMPHLRTYTFICKWKKKWFWYKSFCRMCFDLCIISVEWYNDIIPVEWSVYNTCRVVWA